MSLYYKTRENTTNYDKPWISLQASSKIQIVKDLNYFYSYIP
jgi:hypothetical protein